MCDPVSITMGIMTGLGAIQSAQASKAQGEYQEAMAKNNAIIQERQASDALKRGEKAEGDHWRKVLAMRSKQRAQGAANGVDLNSGSMLTLQEDTMFMGELDALNIRNNAANEAYGHRVGAGNSRAQGSLDAMRGKNAATSTLLTGAGQVAGIWRHAKANPSP